MSTSSAASSTFFFFLVLHLLLTATPTSLSSFFFVATFSLRPLVSSCFLFPHLSLRHPRLNFLSFDEIREEPGHLRRREQGLMPCRYCHPFDTLSGVYRWCTPFFASFLYPDLFERTSYRNYLKDDTEYIERETSRKCEKN